MAKLSALPKPQSAVNPGPEMASVSTDALYMAGQLISGLHSSMGVIMQAERAKTEDIVNVLYPQIEALKRLAEENFYYH
jgi:hypothetical protein